MKHHYVQYHNEDEMGPLEEGGPEGTDDNYQVVSRKAPQDARGSIVWLIAGAGHPRRYCVSYVFEVSDVRPCDPGDDDQFSFKYRGERGFTFEPALELEGEWFDDFVEHQANFSFGLNTINPFHVQELLRRTRESDPFIASLWDDFEESRTIRRRQRGTGEFKATFHPVEPRDPKKKR